MNSIPPGSPRRGRGGYWYTIKFKSRIRGFLTDELSVLFAPSHSTRTEIHINTQKNKAKQYMQKDTLPSTLHLACCLGWKQYRQQGLMQARR